ncbi:MAG: translation elongation factor 4, partial [Elusimicrobiota bacterium]|nr:translation elongation factor 4 [Elusimicrobiota bacterium]
MIQTIRNFCILAHIDHGKSTLADRILEFTGTIPSEDLKPQVLDEMELERERGITIRTKTVRINYAHKGLNYILNLIDTPGHVDFSYEVSRAIIASEGALLLVDASQGVEAQTLSNATIAKKHNLKIIPVINKIDLQTANIDETAKQIKQILEIYESPLMVSAKEGRGVEDVLQNIIQQIPAPVGDQAGPLKAVVFDSFYDTFRGVIVYLRIFDGVLKPGMKITFLSTNNSYEVLETGILRLKLIPQEKLSAGEVGYIIAGIKNISEIKIGDTITEKGNPTVKPVESQWLQVKPFVFAAFFPLSPGEFDIFRTSIEKLHLTDASFTYRNTSSTAFGAGYHCGFLGLLHLEIVKERLEREYGLNLIVTSPNVQYRIKLKNSSEILEIDNPAKFPDYSEIEFLEEPFVKATIITPQEFSTNVIELCKNSRGKVIEVNQLDAYRVVLVFELPLAEIIIGFYDALKSVSRGYASFDYENIGYRISDLVKLEVLINSLPVDAFAYIVHKSKINTVANKIIEKLKSTIHRQLFQIVLQVKADNRIVARDDIRALKKDVLAKCYGGDVTRKRKLLEKQKEGKKKMKQFGRVEIPQETFMAL